MKLTHGKAVLLGVLFIPTMIGIIVGEVTDTPNFAMYAWLAVQLLFVIWISCLQEN